MKELALHMLDIAENGINAGANRIILSITEEKCGDELILSVEDNGRGMKEEEIIKCQDPFYTSRKTRRVGLGIPLFKQHAEMTGGSLTIRSVEGEGTHISATFFRTHPDIQPLGDIEGSWYLLSGMNPSVDIVLRYITERGVFELSSHDVMQSLEIDSLRDNELGLQLKRLIRNNITDISFLDEIIDS